MLTDEEREHLEQLENDKRIFEDVAPMHVEIFGRTLARFGMLEEFELEEDYCLFLLNHEGMRWMIDKHLDKMKAPIAGLILDRLNDEYEDYNEWVEDNRYRRELKKRMQ
jgi:hypothetical protein